MESHSLCCAGDIAAFVSPDLVRLDREQFLALHLDPKNRLISRALISREIVSIGHLTAALVHPREVFKAAILANAAGIAFVHDLPAAIPNPPATTSS